MFEKILAIMSMKYFILENFIPWNKSMRNRDFHWTLSVDLIIFIIHLKMTSERSKRRDN